MPHGKRERRHKRKKRVSRDAEGARGFALKGRIWIDGPEGTFIGYGRVVLLERIKEYGSITKAAKSMAMSYRQAWRLIDSMNAQAPSPYVITSTGGKGGGGTIVTEDGEKAIRTFRQTFEAFQDFLRGEGKTLDFSKEDL